ncbi:TetR/AcrR family transcriptional regulator [Streptomyces phaeochromogenes]|uniref:TetR/AcrR family transcriptional regulator n=1 Tax=Streptomyces phaeochromogenes TaxID=1923 RepID=UPI00368A9D0A
MSSEEILRRASYGPSSPVVGERGARTRQRIVDVTLELFAAHSFHETSVDDIAKAAGVSRATLYQYFGSKDEIFIELMEECGSALMRVVRRLGPLGADLQGFDNLHWWLGEWAWVYDKYTTMFVQWARVDSSETSLKPMINKFVDAYAARVAGRLESSGVEGLELRHAAAALEALVNRFNYLRHSPVTAGLDRDVLLDGLAVVVQLVLFPETSAQVLASLELESGETAQQVLPERLPRVRAERFDDLSARARRTVEELIDAACRIFAVRGYHAANIDAVVAEAGFARGTFYKYFRDKLDLLTAVAEEACGDLVEVLARFADIRPGPDAHDALRAWLRAYLPVHSRYLGVIRVWAERQPEDPTLTSLSLQVAHELEAALATVLGRLKRPYPLNIKAAVLVLHVMLEQVPVAVPEGAGGASEDEVIEIVALFIERGLLNGKPVSRRRGGASTAKKSA